MSFGLFSQVFPPCLSPASLPLFLSPPLLSSLCVCVGLSRPVNLSAFSEDRALCFSCSLSFPFLSFFHPSFSVKCGRDTHSIPHIRTRKQASTNSFSHTPSQVHPPAVSLSHTLITTHTLDALCQKHTPTQGLVFKCSNEDEWAQNEECVSN